jgi:hypothetical protein
LADALGVTIVTSDQVFDAAGNRISPRIEIQLKILDAASSALCASQSQS